MISPRLIHIQPVSPTVDKEHPSKEQSVTAVMFRGFQSALELSVPYYRNISDFIQIERNMTVVTIFKYIRIFPSSCISIKITTLFFDKDSKLSALEASD